MMDGEKMQVVDISAPAPVREIAEMIAGFRKEFIEGLYNGVVEEADKVADSGYDPARGSGRGPWWANGD